MTLQDAKDYTGWLARRIAFWLVVAIPLNYGLNGIFNRKDTTDPASGRSGLGLYTDNLTGCQYVSAGGSGITPRMLGGRHVGCRQEITNAE